MQWKILILAAVMLSPCKLAVVGIGNEGSGSICNKTSFIGLPS